VTSFKVRRALVSVYDKRGAVEFCRGLHSLGIDLLSTGGTAKLLKENKVPVTDVSDFTGFPEMMEGRVKTLHPKIHGGILYRRGKHDEEAERHGIKPIDMVVANLYPFEQTVANPKVALGDAIENIDIGGPAMIRAAAKNFEHVAVVTDPEDYGLVLAELRKTGTLSHERRLSLMAKAFTRTFEYDWAISRHFTGTQGKEEEFPERLELHFEKAYPLRYGENPHQKAAAYRLLGQVSLVDSKVYSGKQMSYNNFLDGDSALRLILEFIDAKPTTVIIKHTNPCGGAIAETLAESYVKANATDPTSAFGSIIAFNRKVDMETAKAIGPKFVDIIIAPGYEPDALRELEKKANRRILDVTNLFKVERHYPKRFRYIAGGMLYQERDACVFEDRDVQFVTKRKPTKGEMHSLKFAMTFAKHTKSNAIIIAQDSQLVGVGAGQMSRIDSAQIAMWKAKFNKFGLKGTVAASDAFIPFPDTVDALAKAGIAALVQPGGSINDKDIIAAADRHGIAMIFTGIRHFIH